MTGFNHTLAGCVIAVMSPAPLAPLLAFSSHFVLDALPHFGRSARFRPYTREFKWLLVFDALLCFISLGLAIWVFPALWWLLIICALTATLPDFLWLFNGKIAWLNGFYKFAGDIQWGERPWGWILELVYAVLFITTLYWLS